MPNSRPNPSILHKSYPLKRLTAPPYQPVPGSIMSTNSISQTYDWCQAQLWEFEGLLTDQLVVMPQGNEDRIK